MTDRTTLTIRQGRLQGVYLTKKTSQWQLFLESIITWLVVFSIALSILFIS